MGLGVGVVGIGVGAWEGVKVGLVVGLVVGEPDAEGVGLWDGTTSNVGCGVDTAVGCTPRTGRGTPAAHRRLVRAGPLLSR